MLAHTHRLHTHIHTLSLIVDSSITHAGRPIQSELSKNIFETFPVGLFISYL